LLKLDHLRRMTDDTGIFQHAIFSVPNCTEGYTTDDNARALALTVLLEELGVDETDEVSRLASRYLAFLWSAFDPKIRRFRNFLSFDRRWIDEVGSEDCHGRALWSLGLVLGRSQHHGLCGVASRLLELALPAVQDFTSPRAWAFTLLGIHEYRLRFPGDRAVQNARDALAERLMQLYREHSANNWQWFEDMLAYSNATLPQALMVSGQEMARQEMVEAGLATLEWLAAVQRSDDGHFVPIGSNGFFSRGGERARFDQQPIEAHATLAACLEAHRQTQQDRWREEARLAFDWFLGRNDLRLPLYDPRTGGCRDGLHSDRTNQNQGAESTLVFLLSLLELRRAAPILQPSKDR